MLPRIRCIYTDTTTYAFRVSPYDVKGIQMLDNKVTAIAKQAMKLPWSPS